MRRYHQHDIDLFLIGWRFRITNISIESPDGDLHSQITHYRISPSSLEMFLIRFCTSWVIRLENEFTNNSPAPFTLIDNVSFCSIGISFVRERCSTRYLIGDLRVDHSQYITLWRLVGCFSISVLGEAFFYEISTFLFYWIPSFPLLFHFLTQLLLYRISKGYNHLCFEHITRIGVF